MVYGDDYPTPDGSCIRDYIHVVDLAKAHVAALKRINSNRMVQPFEVFNVGTGKGNSVLELISSFERVTGVKLNYSIGPRRPGDIMQIWADVIKSADVLEWSAQLGLDDMLTSAWAWEKYINNNPLFTT